MRAVGLAVALLAPVALAEDTVPLQAGVVFASSEPGDVEPALASMQATLAARIHYQTLKSLSTLRLDLRAEPARIDLPNAKVAELRLVALKAHVAQVAVKLPPLGATYSLGKERALYIQAGPYQGGELWLVLSQPH